MFVYFFMFVYFLAVRQSDISVTFFDPSIYWQGLGKHLVDNATSVGILRCSKNPVDARD